MGILECVLYVFLPTLFGWLFNLCAMYGGGGHAMAAGVTLHCPPEQALELMLKAVDEKYPEL